MALQASLNSENPRRKTRCQILTCPGVWLFEHPGQKPYRPADRATVWLSPADKAAKRYIHNHTYDMLEVWSELVRPI